MEQKIIYTNFVEETVDRLIGEMSPASVFILVDHNTGERILPRLRSICTSLKDAIVISVKPGDENKNLDSLSYIWQEMSNKGATRSSLLINLGGGVVTDMGAFAACTFKRGIAFINIPTTLLGAVDAAIGGKTGINFNGLKNEIGSFKPADAVIISTTFLVTLPIEEIKSGYAEMIKHAMISDSRTLTDLLKTDINAIDPNAMLKLVEESTKVKKAIVEKDPEEKGLRKALNFGHTVGHAFESLALERKSPISHGYAVAYGMVVETVISALKRKFPVETMRKLASYIFENYQGFGFSCEDYDRLIDFMKHDKKNSARGEISMTLLNNVGDISINNNIKEDEIKAAFDIYREELQK